MPKASARRLSQILVALSAWFFVAALFSLVIVRILSFAALPNSLANLSNDIRNLQDINTLKEVCVLLVDGARDQRESSWTLVVWGFGFVASWSAIFGIVSLRLFSKLSIQGSVAMPADASFFDDAIDGEVELWKAFWGVYIALPLIVAAFVGGCVFLLKKLYVADPFNALFLVVSSLAFSAVVVTSWWGAAIAWRCSRNTSHMMWHYLARIAIVFYTCIPAITATVRLTATLP